MVSAPCSALRERRGVISCSPARTRRQVAARGAGLVTFDASTRANGLALVSEGRPPRCGDLCHQYARGSPTLANAGARTLPRGACGRRADRK